MTATAAPPAPTPAPAPLFVLQPLLLPAALLAATLPTGLAYHQPPSATPLNQCLAVALWGAVLAALTPRRSHGSTGIPAAGLGSMEPELNAPQRVAQQ